jgi:uroporphyrinogen decarboxylase
MHASHVHMKKGKLMNKRDVVLSLLGASRKPDYIPAAFFLHFDPLYQRGQAAVDKHLEYFRYTGMDFVKIQYEHKFPHLSEIQKPEDWVKAPFYKLDFYQEPLRVVEGLIQAVKKDALVVLTLYSPFMFAGQVTGGQELVTKHIQENPDQVKHGMQVITESLMGFVKECIRLGLDGFYTSTQGGEDGRFSDVSLFNECVRPYDLALIEEIDRRCIFNILHVCDYQMPYRDLTPYVSYPGHIVNASLELTGGDASSQEVANMFGRPYMGGLNRKGVLAKGNPQEIRKEVEDVLRSAPERFILGADCTVPSDTSWDNLKLAISIAHDWLTRPDERL